MPAAGCLIWQRGKHFIELFDVQGFDIKISRFRGFDILHLTPRCGATSASFASLVYKMSHEEFLVEDVSNEKLSCDIRRRRIEEKGRRRFNWKAVIVIPTNQPTKQRNLRCCSLLVLGRRSLSFLWWLGLTFAAALRDWMKKSGNFFKKKKNSANLKSDQFSRIRERGRSLEIFFIFVLSNK